MRTRWCLYSLLSLTAVLAGCRLTPEKEYPFEPLPGAPDAPPVSPGTARPVVPAMPPPVAGSQPPKITVSPTNVLSGRVVIADANGRFMVLNFPIGQMPGIDQQLTIYRHGVKVGEAKVTGPRRDDNIAADTLSGTPQIGDEARFP